jgi:translation initiation factor 2 subunit 3
MSKTRDGVRKPEINIGTIGHVDHGKTTLVKAITGVLTSRHSKELARNITIKLGYASVSIFRCPTCEPPYVFFAKDTCPKGHTCEYVRGISFVDAPGHEVLMTTMLSGAAVIDAALLVISADEPCPQPQTREHLYAAKVLGLHKMIVVQNKIDLVSKERAIDSYKEIVSFLKEAGYSDVPIIPVSAQRLLNIDVLLYRMEKDFPTPVRDLNASLKMPIIRSFDINRPGTPMAELRGGVVGGSILQGKVKVGDQIMISPGLITGQVGNFSSQPIRCRADSLMFDGTLVQEADSGGLVAVGTGLDPSLTKDDRLSGSVLTRADQPPPVVKTIKLELSLFEKLLGTPDLQEVKPVSMGEQLNLNVGVGLTRGTVTSKKGGAVELELVVPVVAETGQRVAVSRQIERRWRLIGHGIVA